MTASSALVEVGHAGAALDGIASGDVHVVAPFETGVVLALIDGLGHGIEARQAAIAAAEVIAAHAGEPVIALVERCHAALRKTRGAVMSLVSLSAATSSITWLGVGNVEGLLLRGDRSATPASEAIQLRGGVVGYQLPPLRATTLGLARGDTVVLASDGVHSGFTVGLQPSRGPQELADEIVRRHARRSDDVLVLVARYLGGAA